MIKCKYVWIIIKFNIPEGKGSIGFAGGKRYGHIGQEEAGPP